MTGQEWTKDANCRGVDTESMFLPGALESQRMVVRHCTACPVRTECLGEALDSRNDYGVWGGMSARQRRALLRRRPEVSSWRTLLESARDEQLQDVGNAAVPVVFGMGALLTILAGFGMAGDHTWGRVLWAIVMIGAVGALVFARTDLAKPSLARVLLALLERYVTPKPPASSPTVVPAEEIDRRVVAAYAVTAEGEIHDVRGEVA